MLKWYMQGFSMTLLSLALAPELSVTIQKVFALTQSTGQFCQYKSRAKVLPRDR